MTARASPSRPPAAPAKSRLNLCTKSCHRVSNDIRYRRPSGLVVNLEHYELRLGTMVQISVGRALSSRETSCREHFTASVSTIGRKSTREESAELLSGEDNEGAYRSGEEGENLLRGPESELRFRREK